MKRIGDLSIRQDGFVTVVTIHRPPHNYISRDLTETLGQALADLDDQDDCRAVLLLAEGKNFCAGARHEPENPETMAPDVRDLEGKYAGVARLFSNRKPIVAGIQGAVVGAGFGLSMLADFRVAADNARFSANFVKIGFCPGFGLPYTLPRVIGAQHAAFMFMTGRRFTAHEVAPWGLVDEVVPLDSLADAALALARELAGNAPLGMASTRRRLREGLSDGVLASVRIDSPEQTRLRLTEDHVEGVLAYRERRPAAFVGR
jgi:enoyl-CoA hydratase/carnithine racemase